MGRKGKKWTGGTRPRRETGFHESYDFYLNEKSRRDGRAVVALPPPPPHRESPVLDEIPVVVVLLVVAVVAGALRIPFAVLLLRRGCVVPFL